jgi:hypothetical protein
MESAMRLAEHELDVIPRLKGILAGRRRLQFFHAEPPDGV